AVRGGGRLGVPGQLHYVGHRVARARPAGDELHARFVVTDVPAVIGEPGGLAVEDLDGVGTQGAGLFPHRLVFGAPAVAVEFVGRAGRDGGRSHGGRGRPRARGG